MEPVYVQQKFYVPSRQKKTRVQILKIYMGESTAKHQKRLYIEIQSQLCDSN